MKFCNKLVNRFKNSFKSTYQRNLFDKQWESDAIQRDALCARAFWFQIILLVDTLLTLSLEFLTKEKRNRDQNLEFYNRFEN